MGLKIIHLMYGINALKERVLVGIMLGYYERPSTCAAAVVVDDECMLPRDYRGPV
jgi:hypothetical protein